MTTRVRKVSQARRILEEYGYKPKKSRGQSFLCQESYLKRIAGLARIGPFEIVLEIGPGPGNLTRRLLEKAGRVVAIEVDPELCAVLRNEIQDERFTLIEADAVKYDLRSIAPPEEKIKVVANIPYNLTTPILFKLLDDRRLFSALFLLMQKEVAEKICAPCGKKPYGILSAQAQMFADCSLALEVPARAFRPRPKVDSTLVRLKILDKPRAELVDEKVYKRVVRAAFAKRRKTIRNSLSSSGFDIKPEWVGPALKKAGVSPQRRAETVSVEEFAAIANAAAEMEAADA